MRYSEHMRERIDTLYRTQSRQVLATLIRLLGDFELAEDAMHEAFNAALIQWESDGMPDNPTAWLISTGRFKGIDMLRRKARRDETDREFSEEFTAEIDSAELWGEETIQDDMLRLIFTCCHPDLAADARVALTLREVCGLTTEEIAHAFLVAPSTLAQRIVRAKAKIKETHIPYRVPSDDELPVRLDTVLHVVYLVFNEGYSASSGDAVTRADLSSEAIRLGRLLLELLPESEVMGLQALMLLQDSRRTARATPEGDLILLEDQDRALWNRDQITEGAALLQQAILTRRIGPFTLQAAIAAVHAEAAEAADTDWNRIVGLYDSLQRIAPSPVIELNRAVAVAMRDGPGTGLALIDDILSRGDLRNYHLAHAARADLCRRSGKIAEARISYEQALKLVQQGPERRFLERRIAELRPVDT